MGVINIAGETIPVINLRKRLSLRDRDIGLSDQLILVRLRKRRLAILVDAVDGLTDCATTGVTIRSNVFPGIDVIEGFVAADERLLLIYDIATLLSWDEEKAVDKAIHETAHTAVE
jgi:purine-binding chemotaxis protein CheW